MAKNTSITLGDHFERFVSRQVASGRYASASEVVRAGLRRLEEDTAQLAALREAIEAGEQSGPAVPFDFDRFIAQNKARKA